MTGSRIRRALALLLIALLCLPLAGLSAQDDARDVIAQALALLADTSYQYTLTFETTNALTDENDATYGTSQVYEMRGENSGADYADTVQLTATPLEAPADTQTTTFERARVDGVFYVRLDALLADELGVAAGWWAEDDLLAAIGDDMVRRFGASQLTSLPTPATLTFDDALIRSISEGAPDEIDGEVVRVFDVELKAVEMMMQESDASAAEQLLAFLEDAELLLRGEFSATFRLWVGADDGRIYRAEMETRAYLPFLELSRGSNPNFNIETTSSARYDISGYGEPVEIEAPAQTQSA